MPIMFNTLLREAGFPLCDVRLVRHKETRADRGHRSVFQLWREERPRFDVYNSNYKCKRRPKLSAPYWAVFVGIPDGKTLFVGLYGARRIGVVENEMPHPLYDDVIAAGTVDAYEVALKTAHSDLIGRLCVDWGVGKRAWIQYAERRDKPVTELRTEPFNE